MGLGILLDCRAVVGIAELLLGLLLGSFLDCCRCFCCCCCCWVVVGIAAAAQLLELLFAAGQGVDFVTGMVVGVTVGTPAWLLGLVWGLRNCSEASLLRSFVCKLARLQSTLPWRVGLHCRMHEWSCNGCRATAC